jgi:hypothetical protein
MQDVMYLDVGYLAPPYKFIAMYIAETYKCLIVRKFALVYRDLIIDLRARITLNRSQAHNGNTIAYIVNI